jgi:hypothetical protein
MFIFEVLLYKMGSPGFNIVLITRMQIVKRCPRISISHKTVSVQLNHACESTRTLACRLQILSEQLNHGREVREH